VWVQVYAPLRLNVVDRTLQVLEFEEVSDAPWVVSEVKVQQVLAALESGGSVRLELLSVLTAVHFPTGKGVRAPEYVVPPHVQGPLAHVIRHGGHVILPKLLTPFVRSDANGVQFLHADGDPGAKDCNLTIPQATVDGLLGAYTWTLTCRALFANGNNASDLSAAEQRCLDRRGPCPDYTDASAPLRDFTPPYLVVISDKTPDSTGTFGGFFSSVGISALYTTLVFALGKFFRSLFAGTTARIPVDELQNPQPLLDLAVDIKFAQAEGLLRLERELYVEMINIFRSPELLQQWTRLEDPSSPPDQTAEG
jgi:hypothetical protein